MSTTLAAARTTTIAATVALLLTACGGSTRPDQMASNAAVDASATAASDSAQTEAAPTEAEPAGTSTGGPSPVAAPPAQTTPPKAAPVSSGSVLSACSPSQRPDGGQYFVVGIEADDPDGGLVARVLPGSSEQARTVLPADTVVDTFWSDGSDGPTGCAVLANGSVWFDIGHPSMASGGWVNARYLETAADDHVDQPEEEADAHADCLYLPDLPDTCNVVFYQGFDVVSVDSMSPDMNGEFQYACVYQGHAPACEVLAFQGPGDGVGNALSMAPTESLVTDCNDLTGVAKRLACAELATR